MMVKANYLLLPVKLDLTMSYLCIFDDIFSKISIKNVLSTKFPFFKLNRDATSPQAFPDHLGQNEYFTF